MARKYKTASKGSSNSKGRKSRPHEKLPVLNHLEGDALAKNLQVLTATIDKLKRTELALQAEVQEIKRDTRTARARYQATVLKSSEEVQRKARASSGPRSQPRSPWP